MSRTLSEIRQILIIIFDFLIYPGFRLNPVSISIVTAADQSHFKSLVQLLVSCEKNDEISRVLFFDLGLESASQSQLLDTFSKVRIIGFPFEEFPTWFNIKQNAGQYAWKPWCIKIAGDLIGGKLIWMDAGNVITGSLRRVDYVVRKYGFFAMPSSGSLKDWTHPKTLKSLSELGFEISPQDLSKQNLSAACLGFNLDDNSSKKLLSIWAETSLLKKVIAPNGSSRANHRQDQALLSCLHYQMNFPKWIRIPNGIYNFRIQQDIDG